MPQKRILVVDDDAGIVEVLEEILDDEGYAVAVAYQGHASIALAKQVQPHLILLDLMLPDLHGTAVAEALRREQEFHQTPIIVLSAAHDAAAICQTMVVQACVTKPFRIEHLLRTIEGYLDAVP